MNKEILTTLQKPWVLLAGILLIAIFTFLPCLDNLFTNWDDPEYVLGNSLLHNLSFENIKAIFTMHLTGKYHPLTILSFAVEYHFFGLLPFLYHLDNLFLHLFNIILVFLFVRKLFQDQNLALLTALLFGIHPLHVEPVAWVVGRKDVLFTACYLGSLLSYLSGFGGSNGRPRAGYEFYWLSLLLFLAAMLSKAMAVSLPVILLLIDFHTRGRLSLKNILQKIPFFILAIALSLITLSSEKSSSAFSATALYAPLWRIPLSAHALLVYLGKGILPLRLSAFYPLPTKPSDLIAASIVAAMLFFILYLLALKERLLKFALLFFLLTIGPALHLVEINDSAAYDRFFYLPSIGVFLVVGKFFINRFYIVLRQWNAKPETKLSKSLLMKMIRQRTACALIFVYVAILIAISYNRCLVWKNSESLWQDVIHNYPDAAVAYGNLAASYMEQGKNAQAFQALQKAINLAPNYALAYYNLGNLLAQKGRYQEALKVYNRSIVLDPQYLNAYNNRGNMYVFMRDYDLALADYDQVIILNPNHLEAHLNRGIVYYVQRKFAAALTDFKKALALDPGNLLARDKIKEIENKKLEPDNTTP